MLSRRILVIWLMFELAIAALLSTMAFYDVRQREQKLATQQQMGIQQLSGMLRTFVASSLPDIHYLASLPSLSGWLNTGSESDYNNLADQYRRFLENYSDRYFQIRLLNDQGQEISRFDTARNESSGTLAIVQTSPDELQDKSERDYFIAAQKTVPGQIYFSAIDLNMENHQIVVPYQPTFRVILNLGHSPALSQSENGHIYLVLNCDLQQLVSQIQQLGNILESRILLVDSRGKYVLSEPGGDVWGDLLDPTEDTPHTLLELPDLWSMLTTEAAYKGDGMLTYQVLQSDRMSATHEEQPAQIIYENPRRYLLAYAPIDSISQLKEPVYWRYLMVWLLILIPSALIALLFARMDAKHREKARAQEHERQRMLEDLNRSNQWLSNFAGIASHDLQEPLRVVQSYITLLQRRYHDQLDEKGQQYIRTCQETAERMRQLISSLLSLSRIQNTAPVLETVDLNKIVQQVLDDVKGLIEQEHAIIHIEHLPEVIGDESQLRLVFQNLISNAIKFSALDNTPEIRIERTLGEQLVLLSIRDNGPGVPDDQKKEVFGLFKRLYSKQKVPGNGIGLAICQSIVEAHLGRIWIEDNHPKGSSVMIELPVTRILGTK